MTLREGLEKLAKECDGGLVDGDNVAEAIRALLSTADSKRCTCPSYLGSSPDERCPKHGSIDPPADSEQREVWTKERHEADMQDLRDEVADLRRKLAASETIQRNVIDGAMEDLSQQIIDLRRKLATASLANAALREAAQELWNAVAHDVTDESKWVGTAMGKLQAVLASVGK